MFDCKVLADSINDFDCRLTTFKIVFPRFILAEMNTHRMFSRNSASSRAIPFERMLKMVSENPFIPIAFQKDHKGMQGIEYLNEEISEEAKTTWLIARDKAVESAKSLSWLRTDNDGNHYGVTKQLCNRLLEPFMWHTVIITASELENFFALRCPKYTFHDEEKEYIFRSKKDAIKHFGETEKVEYSELSLPITDLSDLQWLQLNTGQAEIHMMKISELMWDAYSESTPKHLKDGEWHIPFGDQIDQERLESEIGYLMDGSEASEEDFKKEVEKAKIKIATARCARVSYLNYEGRDDYQADFKLHDSLATSGHWSPFEHCAKSMDQYEYVRYISGSLEDGKFEVPVPSDESEGWSGNFRGFLQYRKMFKNENIK